MQKIFYIQPVIERVGPCGPDRRSKPSFHIVRTFRISARLEYRMTATPESIRSKWIPRIPQRRLKPEEMAALDAAREEMDRIQAEALSNSAKGLRLISTHPSTPSQPNQTTDGPYTPPERPGGGDEKESVW